MAFYNKDGVKITHFEEDDEFAEFFNSPKIIGLVEEDEGGYEDEEEDEDEDDFYRNESLSFWELKAIDHFVEESWLKEQDGK